MKSPLHILPIHEQKHKDSCVAWGLELILKMHEKIEENACPLQSGVEPTTGLRPCDWGFGSGIDYLQQEHKLEFTEQDLELQDFEKAVNLQAGESAIFSLPLSVQLRVIQPYFGEFDCHICLATIENGQVSYRTRQFECTTIFDISFQAFYTFLRSQIKPHYKIHVLLHC